MMPQKFYITTAIDYPNNRPHMGHAFEKIGADVQARYRRMMGATTFFLLGNDENTVKVSKRAAELGYDTQEYVDQMAGQFKDTWSQLEITNDDFIQTSERRHRLGCQRFIQRVFEAGYIYQKEYEALYCEGCEAFKTAKDLVNGRCQNHPNQELRQLQEQNYFFALSRFQEQLLKLYEERPDFIRPATRRNEIVNLVKGGLEDISITRQHMAWGIPTPFDPDQTIYVWFDALLNYITGIGYGTDETSFAKWWPADMHVIGKDITRFHCALWPAMLMAAGLELPRCVQVHGFVLTKGATGDLEKMSKSLGNVVDPMDLSSRFGADAFRYFLMRECPFTADGEFSYERFVTVYNADLANNLGNLYSRTLTMCTRYFDGILSGSKDMVPDWVGASMDLTQLVLDTQRRIENCEYNQALSGIWQNVLDPANRYIDEAKPFELAKRDREACKRVLVNLAEALRISSILIRPFIPSTASKIYHGFSFAGAFQELSYAHVSNPPPATEDLRVTAQLKNDKVEPLFPRIQLVDP